MRVHCPHCDAKLDVRETLRGKTARCPRCHQNVLLEPEPSATNPFMSIDLSDDEYGDVDEEVDQFDGADADFGETDPEFPSAARPKKRKKQSDSRPDEESDDAEVKVKRRRKRSPTPLRMLCTLVAVPFWRSSMEHLPFMVAALACVGVILGFLVGLTRSTAVAGLLFHIVGLPTMLTVFFLMSYPTSCFWKVLIGSSSGDTDSGEWPEGGFGEWVFDMMFVAYVVGMSFLLSAGVAKLRQVTIPSELSSEAYWALIGTVSEENELSLPAPLKKLHKAPVKVTSGRPVLQPGPAWWTTLGAFIVIFPIFVISCMDQSTPAFVPYSPRVLFSLLKNLLSWLVTLVVFGTILGAAATIIVLGATHAPFLTFTLCSPLAAVAMVLSARILGLMSWQIVGN